MRHRRKVKYFSIKTAHRKAMFRNMVTSLFEYGSIKTTVPRAKELRRVADKMISLAKDGSLHARRQALSIIMDKGVVAKLFSDIAEQMADRRGGYTRIVRIGPRRGDGAMMCIVELVTESIKPEKTVAKTVEDKSSMEAPTVIPTAAPDSKEEEEKLSEDDSNVEESNIEKDESQEGETETAEETEEITAEESIEGSEEVKKDEDETESEKAEIKDESSDSKKE